MKKYIIFALLFWGAFCLNGSEVSVFDAGNLNTASPYGLTQSEQVTLKNRQDLGNVKADVDLAKENIEGLKSLLDGINKNNEEINLRLNNLENNVSSNDVFSKDEISKIKKLIRKNKIETDKKIANLNKAIKDLTAIISAKKVAEDKTKSEFEGLENKKILSLGDKYYTEKNYPKAKEAFKILVKNNYKKAYSNYMLGEVEYFSKNYKDAIPYYKTCVALYDQGSYMPRLLYHTGISFDKIKDTKNANKFYSALKKAYPESKEAKAAPNRK